MYNCPVLVIEDLQLEYIPFLFLATRMQQRPSLWSQVLFTVGEGIARSET